MSKPQRCERVYQAVAACTARFSLAEPRKTIRHLQVSAIAEQAGVSPNNASTELCRLFRQGRLVRVDSRPRLYCDLQLLERRLRRTLPAVEYGSLEQFLTELRGEDASAPPQRSGAAPEGGLHAGAASEFDGLIGCGQSLRDAIATAKAAMLYPPFGMHTLLTGETGVGKSNFAACMYDYGRRCGKLAPDARFVTFNCANYSDNPQLLMSQLFGHCRGAFTGADHDRPGLVEHADGGILFLDEIHRLHPEGQEKLFHLIDKGTFRRMGETADDRHVRILIVGATTESPQACMLSTFLRRISVHLVLPPLRERSVQERLTLVLYFIWREAKVLKRRIQLDRDILSALVHYHCPGNIGQLQTDIRLSLANVYFRYLMGQRDLLQIQLSDLSGGIQQGLFISPASRSLLVSERLSADHPDLVIDGAWDFSQVLETYLV